jgi:hypothetical protein
LPLPCHWAAAITTAPAIGAIGTIISIAAIITATGTVIMAITATTAITAVGAEALTPDNHEIGCRGGFAAGQPAAPLRVDTAPAAVMPNPFRDPLNR